MPATEERVPYGAAGAPAPPSPALAPLPLPATLIGPPARGRVLVVAPHPDDESIGVGGTLAAHSRLGDPLHALFVTTGVHGDARKRHDPAHYIALRRQEAQAAAAVLGIGETMFWDFPDSCVVTEQDLQHITALLGQLYARLKPDVVYAPHAAETHSDHHFVGRAALAAHRAAGGAARLFGYEVWTPVQPDLLVDVTADYERKLAAIGCYRSQLQDTDLLGATEGMNRYRSILLPSADGSGRQRAEALLELA